MVIDYSKWESHETDSEDEDKNRTSTGAKISSKSNPRVPEFHPPLNQPAPAFQPAPAAEASLLGSLKPLNVDELGG